MYSNVSKMALLSLSSKKLQSCVKVKLAYLPSNPGQCIQAYLKMCIYRDIYNMFRKQQSISNVSRTM